MKSPVLDDGSDGMSTFANMTAEISLGRSGLVVEFCGEEFPLQPGTKFTIGREADLVVDDDNAFLHRRMVELRFDNGYWWVANIGSRLPVTVTGEAGTLQSRLGPGSRLPIVLPTVAILFTAGETTYEVNARCEIPAFETTGDLGEAAGEQTLGAVDLTQSQFMLILALAENTLRRAGSGVSELPSNAKAAARLGWPITTFNRKLDNVCEKFSRSGVKGLRGDSERLATSRRARLVEYTVTAKIVRPEHLPMLDEDVAEQSDS
jgi:hypothetical protein